MANAKSKAPWQAQKIVSRKLAELKPSPLNSRAHPPEQIERLRASLREFGFPKPILIDDKDEIIAGHGITMAAIAEGLGVGPTIVAQGWSDEQKRAYRIFDNWSAAQSQWLPEMVDSELEALGAAEFNLEPLGLLDLDLPELEVEPVVPPIARNRKKTTIFLSIKNEDATKARKAVVAALNKAKIEHNL